MKYLIFLSLLLFSSCNVAKNVFRHKDKSIIQVKKDSIGSKITHIDTSRKTTIRTITNTDIIRQGTDIKGKGTTDLDQARIGAQKGKALVVPLLDSLGRVVGSLLTIFDTVNNRLNQVANLNAPPEEYHHSEQTEGKREQKGITDKEKYTAVKTEDNKQHDSKDVTKDVKRSPVWIKIGLIISGVVLVLIAFFKKGQIWKWFKNKLIKK